MGTSRFRLAIAVLAAACALGAGGPGAAPAPVAADLAELRKELRSQRPEARRAAVRRLAELGSRDAYELLLGALEDRDSQVADEAQVRAAAATDPACVAQLLGARGILARAGDVRERAAEAVGRLTVPVDARSIQRALRGADPAAARMLVWSAERLAAAQRLAGDREDLARALDDLLGSRADPCLRGAALLALQRIDARAADRRIPEAVAAREPELRCAAALAARAWGEMAAVALAGKIAADPDAGVRAGVIELLAGITGRESALLLSDRLEHEERSRLRWRILAHLRALSGEDHGFDPEAWRGWARRRDGAVTTGPARPSDGPVGDTRVALAGLNLVSDRAVFLIDLSGSMWGTRIGGRTRKEIVDGELRRALEALPRTARFNVVPYASAPYPWEKKLVPAEPAQVRRAIESFERCHHSGRGNVWDAIGVALEDPAVDAVTILTDGVPTGGPHWNLDLILELLLERNRFRNVAFDSILVDAPRARAADWARLADRSAGRSIAVEIGKLGQTPGSGGGRGG